MPTRAVPFTALHWTPNLASTLEATSGALSALNARVSSSLLSRVWQSRAALSGYAAALRLQQEPLDEIDVFSHFCGLRLPDREVPITSTEPFSEYARWEVRMGEERDRHWREALPFPFDLPEGWDNSPKIIRSLTLLEAWCRHDKGLQPWLQLPIILQQVGATSELLPNLVAGHSNLRRGREDRTALLTRLLRRIEDAARTGLSRLAQMEDAIIRFSAMLGSENRPGKLSDLGLLLLVEPILTPRNVADRLKMSISGAGRLLDRAAAKEILVEISGRDTWRVYSTKDVASALGLAPVPRGRPHSLPEPPSIMKPLFESLAP